MRAANFCTSRQSNSTHVFRLLFVEFGVYKKEKEESSVESPIITIFVLINTLIIYCCSCVRTRNSYCLAKTESEVMSI